MDNLLVNADFALWGNGPAAAPTCWQTSNNVGNAPLISRVSGGQVSPWAAQLTRQDGNCFLAQNPHAGVVPGRPPLSFYAGKWITGAALITWDQPMENGVRAWDTLCNPTISTNYETHGDMHRGYGETRLVTVEHLVSANPNQIAFNALSVKRQENGAGVFSAKIHWAGLFLGRREFALRGAWDDRVSALQFGTAADQPVQPGTTVFLGATGASWQRDYVSYRMPFPAVVYGLLARTGAPPGAGESMALTFCTGNDDTALACTVAGANQEAEDTARQIFVPAGTLISVKAAASAGAAASPARVTLTLRQVPCA